MNLVMCLTMTHGCAAVSSGMTAVRSSPCNAFRNFLCGFDALPLPISIINGGAEREGEGEGGILLLPNFDMMDG
jgi:hypothetical protein